MLVNSRTAIVLVALCAACGGEENNDATNNPSTNNVTNTVLNNMTAGADGGWTATVAGDVMLMGGGAMMSSAREGTTLSLSATDPETSTQLAINVIVGDGEIETREYQPQLFDLESEGYECVAHTDVRVTLTSADPPAGSFQGTVTCALSEDDTQMFDGAVSGEFVAAAL